MLFLEIQMYIERYQILQQHYMHARLKLHHNTQLVLRMYQSRSFKTVKLVDMF